MRRDIRSALADGDGRLPRIAEQIEDAHRSGQSRAHGMVGAGAKAGEYLLRPVGKGDTPPLHERHAVGDRENLLVSAAYDPEKDIVFYQTPSIVSQIVLHAGDYLILAPDEAHKPRCTVCAPCSVVKAVVKIPVPEGASNK